MRQAIKSWMKSHNKNLMMLLDMLSHGWTVLHAPSVAWLASRTNQTTRALQTNAAVSTSTVCTRVDSEISACRLILTLAMPRFTGKSSLMTTAGTTRSTPGSAVPPSALTSAHTPKTWRTAWERFTTRLATKLSKMSFATLAIISTQPWANGLTKWTSLKFLLWHLHVIAMPVILRAIATLATPRSMRMVIAWARQNSFDLILFTDPAWLQSLRAPRPRNRFIRVHGKLTMALSGNTSEKAPTVHSPSMVAALSRFSTIQISDRSRGPTEFHPAWTPSARKTSTSKSRHSTAGYGLVSLQLTPWKPSRRHSSASEPGRSVKSTSPTLGRAASVLRTLAAALPPSEQWQQQQQ